MVQCRGSNLTDSSVICTETASRLRTTEIIKFLRRWALFRISTMEALGLAAASKPKRKCPAGGKFKASWKLPAGIMASSKGDQYAHCKLCKSDFSVVHGGFNDVTHHTKGPTHQQIFKDSSSTQSLTGMLGQPSELSHIRKVTTAEVIMSNVLHCYAQHLLSNR